MHDRFAEHRRALEDAVLRGPGHTKPALRESLARGEPAPEALQPLVEKVRARAYEVTDEDVSALMDRYGEDELFEVVVSTALGAAIARLHAGLLALEEEA
jgi:hypothetical protein